MIRGAIWKNLRSIRAKMTKPEPLVAKFLFYTRSTPNQGDTSNQTWSTDCYPHCYIFCFCWILELLLPCKSFCLQRLFIYLSLSPCDNYSMTPFTLCYLGKGKTKKEAKAEPTNDELRSQAVNILKEVDFNTVCISALYV